MIDDVPLPRGWTLAAQDFGDLRGRRQDAKGGEVCGVLIWNRETGEGEVLLRRDFAEGCGIVAADALKDWGGLIDGEYEGGFPLRSPRRSRKKAESAA